MAQHVADGNLNEARRVEHKEMLPAKGKPGASAEIAQDVASLTVDGGWLIYGIRDRPQLEVDDVVGVDNPESVRTRVAAIALAQIDPPVSLDGQVLPDPNSPERGLVVFTVPASPDAPHMVGDVFWGRGDRQRARLSEPEVARLYSRRALATADVTAELDRLARDFDPLALSPRSGGRLMVVARPSAVSLGANLSEHLGSHYFPELVYEFVRFNATHSPVFQSPQNGRTDSEGMIFSYEHATGTDSERERGSVWSLIRDDGTLWWVSSLIETHAEPVTVPGIGGTPQSMQHYNLINTDRLLEVVHSAVEFASGLAYDRLAYRGPWQVAIRLVGIAGARSHTFIAKRGDGGHPYRLPVYEQTTSTSTTEMREHAPQVVERLVERLLRGIGVKDMYLPYDDPADIGRNVRWGLR